MSSQALQLALAGTLFLSFIHLADMIVRDDRLQTYYGAPQLYTEVHDIFQNLMPRRKR